MALRPRQTHFYQDVCTIYRRNVAKAASGEWIYSALASAVPCKHFTQPNFDTPAGGGDFTQVKVGNIFTSDLLHLDLAQDIAAEDVVLVTVSPTTASRMTWYRVAAEPRSRGGVANVNEVYLVPCAPPKVI